MKTLRFFPEMIVLFVLLGLCVHLLYHTNEYRGGIGFALESKDTEQQFTDFLERRVFTEFVITGQKEHDHKELLRARLKVREIVKSKSQNKGVSFRFSDKAQYWAFIEVLNILQIEQAEVYGLRNDVLFMGNSTQVKRDSFPPIPKIYI
jgi:uncharacterized protein YktA (UPF0223 family)